MGISEFLTTLWCFGFYSRKQALPQARLMAETALTQNPKSGLAHSAVAVQDFTDWYWEKAGLGFQKALELDPLAADVSTIGMLSIWRLWDDLKKLIIIHTKRWRLGKS